MFYRDSWIQIDLDVLKENINKLKSISNKKFIAVIKANGYGNGDIQIARACIEADVDILAVSCLDEALSLRKNDIDKDILVLGYVAKDYLKLCIENNITVTAVSSDWVNSIMDIDIDGLKLHVKIDTGMNRLGINYKEDINELIKSLVNKGVIIDGIFTHFACSDEEDNTLTNKQMERFKERLDKTDYKFNYIHTSNSDATIHYHEDISNATRCGLAMFGISSYTTDLKPVMSLYTKIVNVKTVSKGETIGYSATYTTSSDEIIATVPIGYADGWVRKHKGREVFVDGGYATIVGNVCMDQMMIRLDKHAEVGSVVELIGPNISIQRVAKEIDTIPYEVMTLLSDRLAKVFYEDGKCTQIVNPRLD